jgi:hypothetical protein
LENLCDVGILSGRITVLLISAVTIIRPKSVDSPAVIGAGLRTHVPKLCLENQTTGRLEAASVLNDRGVHARKRQVI